MDGVSSRKLTWGICIAGITIAIISFFFLPEIIPVHFAGNGVADDFGNKIEIFLMPILLLAVTILSGIKSVKYVLMHSKTWLTVGQYQMYEYWGVCQVPEEAHYNADTVITLKEFPNISMALAEIFADIDWGFTIWFLWIRTIRYVFCNPLQTWCMWWENSWHQIRLKRYFVNWVWFLNLQCRVRWRNLFLQIISRQEIWKILPKVKL